MRAVLSILTALPLPQTDDDQVPVAWPLTAVVGLGLGVVWFVVQQLTVVGVGPLVAGAVVVAVSAALTGSRSLRGLATVADQVTAVRQAPAAPPAAGVGTVAVAIVILAEMALIQRVTLAPAILVVVPMIGRVAQVLVLRDGDQVGVQPPVPVQKVTLAALTLVLLAAPIPIAALERPIRLNGPVVGLDYAVLGLTAMVIAFLAGSLTGAWLRARLGSLTPAGWHTICAVAEVVALVVIAVPVA